MPEEGQRVIQGEATSVCGKELVKERLEVVMNSVNEFVLHEFVDESLGVSVRGVGHGRWRLIEVGGWMDGVVG